jgi:hypothetical protein
VGFIRAVLLLLLCATPAFPAGQSNAAPAQSFTLDFVPSSPSLLLNLELGREEVRFRKEPEFGRGKVLRRAFSFGAGGGFLGFAVDLAKGVLYLDLNQNLDLTDDTGGVLQKASGGSPSFMLFRPGRIDLAGHAPPRSYSFSEVYFVDGRAGYALLRSAYSGKISLHGREWVLSIQDNLDGVIDGRDQFTLAPASGGESPGYDAMHVPNKLFLDGRLYRIHAAFSASSGVTQMSAEFVEIPASMGELVLEGSSLERLVLEGDGLAVLDSPAPPVLVPAGEYKVGAAYVKPPAGDLLLASREPSSVPRICVSGGASTPLKIGAPLGSSVDLASDGDWLRVNYILRGRGGEAYTPVNPDKKNPPKVSIYQGERLRGAGNFSFG